jgi:hypothetical protein
MSSSTTVSPVSGVRDEKFYSCFAEILQRWQNGSVTADDIEYLYSITISELDYISLTEQFPIRHGIELIDYHIELVQHPRGLHEHMAYIINIRMNSVYRRDITGLGSMSNLNCCHALTF